MLIYFLVYLAVASNVSGIHRACVAVRNAYSVYSYGGGGNFDADPFEADDRKESV